MILKCKKWDRSDVKALLEHHRLTHDQFHTLSGIEVKTLEKWLKAPDVLDHLSCLALDRVDQLLNEFFRKHEFPDAAR